jgi:serine/threonine protein phosphatase PrpC
MKEKSPRESSEADEPTPLELQALYKGLDAAAPTSDAWRAGHKAYTQAIANGLSLDEAYWSALDAAAPTSTAWKAGYRARQNLLQEVLTETSDSESSESHIQDDVETMEYGSLPLHTVSSFLERKSSRRTANEVSEDRIVADDERGLYGVYDGMGGAGGNPRAAADAVADSVQRTLSDVQPRSIDELKQFMHIAYQEADKDVRRDGQGGSAVATTVKIVTIEGRTYAGIAHTGDTRLFMYSKSRDSFTAVTEDQSRGNVVFNGFPHHEHMSKSDQFDAIELQQGDRLMLCSDGITGDYPEQALSSYEFLESFRQLTTYQCAEYFMRLSKKVDDKSIVVIDAVVG